MSSCSAENFPTFIIFLQVARSSEKVFIFIPLKVKFKKKGVMLFIVADS